MLEVIKNNNEILGYIIKYKKKIGVNFLTPKKLNHQIGFIKHKKKYVIKPHRHFKNLRKINYTSEVLLITKGKIRVDFYSKKEKYLFSRIIKKNEIIILIAGGHGFEVLKNCEIIEVKQGPYNQKKDKIVFKPINNKFIKIR